MLSDIVCLLKRLEIIRNLIILEDIEDIQVQSQKLAKITAQLTDLQIILETGWIVELLNKFSFADAVRQIDTVTDRLNGMILWQDPTIHGLKAEINAIENHITTLEAEIGEIERIVHEFEVRNTCELGAIALKILTFKRRKAARNVSNNENDLLARKQLEEAKSQEQLYKSVYESTLAKPLRYLTEEQAAELKNKFKKIAKLTHPDLVDKRFEKDAAAIFNQAKEARDNNDLSAINEILAYLENGVTFVSRHSGLAEKDALNSEARYMRHIMERLSQKLIELKNSDNYQMILTIENWDHYFSQHKIKLTLELEMLERAVLN
jgi:hypothetical protein